MLLPGRLILPVLRVILLPRLAFWLLSPFALLIDQGEDPATR